MQEREQWRSGLGFALAAAGSAVGLGNLWGFAYRSSQGGGLAFLLLYLSRKRQSPRAGTKDRVPHPQVTWRALLGHHN